MLANARSRVIFQTAPPTRSRLGREVAPYLTPADILGLGPFEVVVSLSAGNRVAPPATGRTAAAPPRPAWPRPHGRIARAYGDRAREVEAAIRARHAGESRPRPVGRREVSLMTHPTSVRASVRVDAAMPSSPGHRRALSEKVQTTPHAHPPEVNRERSRYVTHGSGAASSRRHLSDRERAVLGTLHRVRVATVAQLERLHFTDVTRRQARAVLAAMVERRLIARLPRQVGGVRAGSAGYVYVLDVAGQRLTPHRRPAVQRPWPVGTAVPGALAGGRPSCTSG